LHNPRTTPSWRKVCGTEERKEGKKNNHKNSGSFRYTNFSRNLYMGDTGPNTQTNMFGE
jgi:hypothetical protein